MTINPETLLKMSISDLVRPVRSGGVCDGTISWDDFMVQFEVVIAPGAATGMLTVRIPPSEIVQEIELGSYAAGRLRKLPADSGPRGKNWYAIDSKQNNVRFLYYIPDKQQFVSRWDAAIWSRPSWCCSGRDVAARAAMVRDKAHDRASGLRPGSKAWTAAIGRRDAAQTRIDQIEEARHAKREKGARRRP